METNTELLKDFLFGRRPLDIDSLLSSKEISRVNDDCDGDYTDTLTLIFSEDHCTLKTKKRHGSIRFRNWFGGGLSLNGHAGLHFLYHATHYHTEEIQTTFPFFNHKERKKKWKRSKVLKDLWKLFEKPYLDPIPSYPRSGPIRSTDLTEDASVCIGPDGDMYMVMYDTESVVHRAGNEIIFNGLILLGFALQLDNQVSHLLHASS
jgi:hypothetical protein